MTGRTGVGVRGCGPVQITQLCVHYVRRRRPKSTAHRRAARVTRGEPGSLKLMLSLGGMQPGAGRRGW